MSALKKAKVMASPLVGPFEDADLRNTAISGKVCSPAEVDMVIFHAPCSDGFAAAHAAFLCLGDRATYFGASHEAKNKEPPDVRDKTVVIVDFSYDLETTTRMQKEAKALLILDHHASAESVLAQLPEASKVFEMKQSGATLSWNFFHPGEEVPMIYRYVEDRDIWRWQMKGAKEWGATYDTEVFPHISNIMGNTPASVFASHPFHVLYSSGLTGMERLVSQGEKILEYQRGLVQQHVKSATLRALKDFPFTAQVVNATVLVSDIGNTLAGTNGSSLAIMTSILPDNRIKCSMRSQFGRDASAADVSLIARHYGGGGHKAAASFVVADFAAYTALFRE